MILLYHKIAPDTPTIWWVSVDAFDGQMADLQAYDVVHLDDYDATNPRHAVITFDGVYENVYRYALPILKKWGYPFELFVIGAHIGGDNSFDSIEPLTKFASLDQLEEMSRNGGYVQWHTATHQRLDGLSAAVLERELAVPPQLSSRLGHPNFRWLAYPHGDHSEQTVAAVKARFEGALSCEAGDDLDRYQLNRVTVLEETRLTQSSVAVIVVNYNYRNFVAEAIESVLAQTLPADEILVIDDCSTDGSEDVIQRYEDKVRYVRNEHNLGIIENFNKAVGLTSSTYVAILGADNRMRSDYVERCKSVLDRSQSVGVVYTDMLIFGARAKLLADIVGAVQVGESMVERSPIYFWAFPEPTDEVLGNFDKLNFIHGSSMYRRQAYNDVGGYRLTNGPEDHDLFKRMLDEGWAAKRSPNPLIEYRQHSATQANTALNLQIELDHWRSLSKTQGISNLLAQKDKDWTARLEKTADDFHCEIARIAEERDQLLAQKDKDWTERLEKTADDFRREIARIAEERDQLIANTKSVWENRLFRVAPQVSVIIVNYNGCQFLPDLLNSISAQTLRPAEVILVDNASTDGSIELLRLSFPLVRVIKSPTNLGFAAGNNLGVKVANYPLVALLNNDTVVDPYWLEALVECWLKRTAKGELIGAVAPKINFLKKFLTLKFISPTFCTGDDSRQLGIAIDLSETLVVGSNYLKPLVVSGAYDEESWPTGRNIRWTDGDATIMLPIPDKSNEAVLHLVASAGGHPNGVNLTVMCENIPVGSCQLSAEFTHVEFVLPKPIVGQASWIINNAGSCLDQMGNAADTGINQKDCGQFDSQSSVDAFCGCSALIARERFLSLGGFDERLFMYYEDVDLSWRMRRAGLLVAFEPKALVFHVHAGSSREWSPNFRYRVVKNKRLIGIKNAKLRYLPWLCASLLYRVTRNFFTHGLLGYRKCLRASMEEISPAQIECKAIHHSFMLMPRLLIERFLSNEKTS